MTRFQTIAIAIIASTALWLATSVRCEPARSALIVANATYAALPGIPGCARSANAVAAAARTAGFDIIERQDASTGGIDAGITEFSAHLSAGKGAALVYVCSYATDFNNRTFLLPATARIARPTDALTQGVLAKSLLATVSREPATVAVVVFDFLPAPDGPARIDVDALAALAAPDGVAVIAASEPTVADSPTPLAAALIAALAEPVIRTDGLLAGVRSRLRDSKLSAVAYHEPVRSDTLVGPPPPPPPPVPDAKVATAQPTPTPIPDEAQMTEIDRRKVQGALVRLGYYDHQIDGRFGPETRAAIRRFQHEIGGEMSGHLTAAQATRLVDSR